MADFTSKFAYRYRKGLAALSIGVRQTATTADASVPTITSGTGVPTSTEPNGSLFLRTDGTTAALVLYSMVDGTWTPIDGS